MANVKKTEWLSANGTLIFILPDCSHHPANAQDIDRPKTLCDLMDTLANLSPNERRTFLKMASSYELAQVNPRKGQ